MKILLTRCSLFGFLLLWAAVAPGQGTVNFNNALSGVVRSPVYNLETDPWVSKYGNTTAGTPVGTQVYTGALLSGSAWRAQVWAAPGNDQPDSALQPGFPITTFRSGSAQGFVASVIATLTGVPVDCPVATVQVRVWPAAFSNNWQLAYNYWAAGQIPIGYSQKFNVTNIGGGNNSAAALTGLRSFCLWQVPDDNFVPPFIVEHPQSQVAAVGAAVSFGATVVAGGKTTWIQWRKDNTYVGDPIVSYYTTNLTLLLTNVQPTQVGTYSLVATNIYGASYSSNATLTLLGGNLPVIQTQPIGTTTNVGAAVQFLVAATGEGDLSYQWQHNNNPLSGRTAAQLLLADVQQTNVGNYSVVVSNANGSVTSSNAALALIDPSILSLSPNTNADLGDSVSLSVTAVGTPPLHYQWQLNGALITGATNSDLNLNNLQATNFGTYSVVITNAYGVTTGYVELQFISGIHGTIAFNNHTLLSPQWSSHVYAPEPSDPSRALTGNSALDLPTGAQVYTGALLSGTNYRAEIWAVKGSNQPASGLVAASPATSFRTDDAAGHFVYTTATFANVPGDYPVATLQIRAWETRGGTITNWSQVLSDPTIPRGASPLFTVTNIGGVLNTPPLVLPHQSFNLHIATKDGPSLEDAVMSASGFEFTVNDQSADRNQIEYRSLADTNWIYLAIVSNHYGKVRFKDLFAPDVPRFYRAVRLP